MEHYKKLIIVSLYAPSISLDVRRCKSVQEYKLMLEEAKKYDHRELTKKQELFFFHPLR